MNSMAVGTAVVARMNLKSKAKLPKWHCECVLTTEATVFISVKAATAVEASEKVQKQYERTVEYVLDILTHDQMEHRKRHLKPSILGAVGSY